MPWKQHLAHLGEFQKQETNKGNTTQPTVCARPKEGRARSKTRRLGLASAPRAPSPALTVLAPKGNTGRLHLDSERGGETDPSVAATFRESSASIASGRDGVQGTLSP